MSRMEEQKDSPVYMCNFVVGEEIEVVDGPFSSFNGNIEEIDEERIDESFSDDFWSSYPSRSRV